MKKQGSIFTVAIALFGMVTMWILGYFRYISMQENFKATLLAAVVIIYSLWLLSEFRVTVGEVDKSKVNEDRGTCEAYAIGRFLTMLCAIGFESLWDQSGAWLPLGLVLFFSGMLFRGYAIHVLGKFYSHRVRTPNNDTIIADGPYRFLRHPAYAGMLVAHIGILILFFNWFLLVAFFAIFIPVLVRRIRVEESHLLTIEKYRAFAATRARLAPGIW